MSAIKIDLTSSLLWYTSLPMILRHNPLDARLPLDHAVTRPRQKVILKSNNNPKHAHAPINSNNRSTISHYDWLNENEALLTLLRANPLHLNIQINCTSICKSILHLNMQINRTSICSSVLLAPNPRKSSHIFAPLWGGVVTSLLLLEWSNTKKIFSVDSFRFHIS